MSLFNIFVQLLGIIGIIFSILSFQCKKHKPLLLLKTGNELLFGFQYILLGAYTGAAMNIIGCIRNLIFAKMVENGRNTVRMRFAFSVLFLIFSIFTWSGLKSILIGIAKVISTFAYGSASTGLVRILIFITSISWFVYNLIVGSYAGCINEFLTICSIVIGIIRFDLPKKTTA